MKQQKQWFAFWECAQGTGRPELLRVVSAEVAPWVKFATLTPWASGDVVLVGAFGDDEDGAWDMGMAMVTPDSEGFLQWR